MAGKVRKMFPGGNTANGFYSFFEYIIPQNVNRIFCLKGGPGTGKSSLMKKIGKEFSSMGYDVELHFCSSDPNSLDGVVIKGLNVVLLDATAPHIVDPKLPGAVDQIVNLGDHWDETQLEPNKDKIKECNDNISECFQRAFKFLKSSEPIFLDIESKNTKCMDWGKINKITEDFIENLFKDVESGDKSPRIRHLFGSAITPIGYIDYSDNLFEDIEKVYYLDGDIGYGKSSLLRSIYKKAEQKNLDVEVYHFPLIVDKLQAVCIPKLNVVISTSKLFKDKEAIDLYDCVNEEKLEKYKVDLGMDKQLFEYLIENAISNLKRAKSEHDVIEEYYINAMNFEDIEKTQDALVQKILKYR